MTLFYKSNVVTSETSNLKVLRIKMRLLRHYVPRNDAAISAYEWTRILSWIIRLNLQGRSKRTQISESISGAGDSSPYALLPIEISIQNFP